MGVRCDKNSSDSQELYGSFCFKDSCVKMLAMSGLDSKEHAFNLNGQLHSGTIKLLVSFNEICVSHLMFLK